MRPQFSQTICIPALRAAGIAESIRRCAALLPSPSAGRPRYVERKKFCISIITRALIDGEMIMGLVIVDRDIDDVGDGRAYSGGAGRVRSNSGGDEE